MLLCTCYRPPRRKSENACTLPTACEPSEDVANLEVGWRGEGPGSPQGASRIKTKPKVVGVGPYDELYWRRFEVYLGIIDLARME